ncbi:geranylgeranyl pyrophosphate synthetase [Colletotrichum sp. SAR11_57]|nr:geranylgeranyl pyrophosphate synthetase [Colletotrichum sp. SAR11_57]
MFRLSLMVCFAAVFQNVDLPIAVSKDRGTFFVDQNAARVPEFPFAPLFRATTSMNPSFRFDDVDILVNRNSLRKLLDFSAGRSQDSFRLNLHLVHRTLVIERCERTARELISGSKNSGWGRNFERKFTKYPSGLEDSAAHHRALRYQLGDLTCVVRFEVDACYERTAEGTGSESLEGAMGRLTIEDSSSGIATTPQLPKQPPMAQEMAAEIKTATKLKSPSAYMPQLWFGRTPWLIIGQHANGNFEQLKITDTAALFASWEERHQADLRKLVTVLARLREAVAEHGGSHCVAIYEKTANTPGIKVYLSSVLRKAVPDDLRRMLWNSLSTGPSAR